MNEQINAAIQVLPEGSKDFAYRIVDKAIEEIKNSGLTYYVCPFETVVEGNYKDIMHLIERIRDACYRDGANNLIVNLKLQFRKNNDVFISDKMKKYS